MRYRRKCALWLFWHIQLSCWVDLNESFSVFIYSWIQKQYDSLTEEPFLTQPIWRDSLSLDWSHLPLPNKAKTMTSSQAGHVKRLWAKLETPWQTWEQPEARKLWLTGGKPLPFAALPKNNCFFLFCFFLTAGLTWYCTLDWLLYSLHIVSSMAISTSLRALHNTMQFSGIQKTTSLLHFYNFK